LLSHVVPLRARRTRTTVAELNLEHVLLALDRAGSRMPSGGRCLRRAVALWCLLRWYGIHSDIHLGVRRDDDDVAAHAWLVCDGVPIGESDDVAEKHVLMTVA
jgi:hypothetical protein